MQTYGSKLWICNDRIWLHHEEERQCRETLENCPRQRNKFHWKCLFFKINCNRKGMVLETTLAHLHTKIGQVPPGQSLRKAVVLPFFSFITSMVLPGLFFLMYYNHMPEQNLDNGPYGGTNSFKPDLPNRYNIHIENEKSCKARN